MHLLPFLVVVATGTTPTQSPNFEASEPNCDIHREVVAAAERLRESFAIEWLGRRLPNWRDRCTISLTISDDEVDRRSSFEFQDGEVFDWRLQLTGTRESILQEQLPQEVLGMLLATQFRRPLDLWIVEGAKRTVAGQKLKLRSLRRVQDAMASGELISLRKIVNSKLDSEDAELVRDQATTLVMYMLHIGGKRQFIECIAASSTEDWGTALHTVYGIKNWKSLDTQWRDWIQGNSPVAAASSDDSSRANEQRPDQLGKQAVALFFMADWCGPCQRMAPTVKRLQEQGYHIDIIDVDQERELTEEFDITSIPQFVKLGESAQGRTRIVGVSSEDQLRELLK